MTEDDVPRWVFIAFSIICLAIFAGLGVGLVYFFFDKIGII